MTHRVRDLLGFGVLVAVAACASSPRAPSAACEVVAGPPACEAQRPAADTARYAELKQLTAALDSVLIAVRTGRLRSMRPLADTALYAQLVQLTQELDSILAGVHRERGTRPRP